MAYIKKSVHQEAFENYIANALKYVVNNTAGQEERTMLNMTFNEIINPETKQDIEDANKKADAIINKFKNQLGGG